MIALANVLNLNQPPLRIFVSLLLLLIVNSCTECKDEDTRLTTETKEWVAYYQNNEYSIFTWNDKVDTLFITNKFGEFDEETNYPGDNCSKKDCYCEIRSYDLVSEHISFNIYANNVQNVDFNIDYIPKSFGRVIVGVRVNTSNKSLTTDGYYKADLIQYQHGNDIYEAVEISCIDCNEVTEKGLVISKDMGVLEYQDNNGNKWVRK